MFEKDLTIPMLLDFYGELLTENQRETMVAYYEDDMSLGEIAAGTGITRQGVRDTIKRGEEQLKSYEERLGLIARLNETLEKVETIKGKIEQIKEINSKTGMILEIHSKSNEILQTIDEIIY